MYIIVAICLSALVGIGLLILSLYENISGKAVLGRRSTYAVSLVTLAVAIACAMVCTWVSQIDIVLFNFIDDIQIVLRQDGVGRLFLTVGSLIWMMVALYSYKYMKHEKEEKRFMGFLLLVYSVLICLDSAGNLISFYFFYEFMTLTSVPLVLHSKSREAIMAALKYLFYSLFGAYGALFGIYVMYRNCSSLDFVAGGVLDMETASSSVVVIQVAVFCMLLGFGAKAGMFPLHAWLPTAHPVAPAPASAALSSIIVKGGVLALIRTVYYIVGVDFIRGTWIQSAWMTLSLITVFMGSMLAYRERVFKKRLAYSTVSQASYIVFGLSVLSPLGFTGALLHFAFHAIIKCCLFLTAGIFIYETGNTKVDDYAGIGNQKPMTLWAYTFASLALIGIPPTSGFISKWYLANGALAAGIGVWGYMGPVILLLSALLTAGYLLPVTTKGFFGVKGVRARERLDVMNVVVVVLSILAVLMGVFPNAIVAYISDIANTLF